MTAPSGMEPVSHDYRGMGLITNPFKPYEPFQDGDDPGVKLIAHAAANRLLCVVDRLADEPEPAPIWIEKAGELPEAYYLAPLAEALGTLGKNTAGSDVILAYVPLDMMRMGRVRAALGAAAERVAGVDVDLTLACWLRRTLDDPDPSLEEYAAIAETDLAGLLAALQSNPSETMERYLGSCEQQREGVADTEMLMRISTARLDALDTDPDEDAETKTVEAPDDQLAELFTQSPEADLESEAAGEAEGDGEQPERAEPDDGLPRADDLVAYFVAHVKTHLSPVIARAIRAYRAQGITSMTEELKITKAPTKTLTSLVRFATCRYRKVLFLFDRFEMWPGIPQDLQLKILGTFSQLRWALRDGGVLAVSVASGEVRELEEQFGSATRVVWDMPGLAELEGESPRYDPAMAQMWVDAATLTGAPPIDLASGPLASVAAASDGSLKGTAMLLAAAIDDAAARGVKTVDDAAVQAALAAGE